MAASLPKKIGKYEVVDVIGKGGMGIVYRAQDPFLDRLVAIKIMTISYADHPELLERFYREAKATAHLQHPNIVTVFELGEQDGSPYMVMQYLEGVSLEAALHASQKLNLLQKLDIIIETCNGLAYAHQRGIVHRDIKPGNIMVLKDGSVKIVDFGIARIGDTNFTRTGQFMGSLSYMSLEQLNDKLQVDQRTDVYSTGVVLYQIVTGALPFVGESTGATLMKIMNDPPPPFSKFLPSFPPELEAITLKALAKDRDQRYGSAEELAFELSELRTRLRQESIDAHMRQAEQLMQKSELSQASEHLFEVLRIDKQHARAMGLLRSVRKQIEKEHSAERARQLREQAEDALRREDFDPALGYVEQAIGLDTTNFELQQLRSKIQAAKVQIEHMRVVFQRAENAHRAGNLDTAKQAIEELMGFRPDDTRVKSLYRMIQKELADRARQKQVETLLQSAQKELSARNYAAALGILKEAESIDSDAPQVRLLLEKANAAQEQERRRQELAQISRQVEEALNADDPESAIRFANDGLKRFPNEPSLSRLRELAETQRQVAETKSFVRDRLASARQMLDAGDPVGAVRVLEDGLRQAPGNPNLASLMALAQERANEAKDDQARALCIQQANDALGRKCYAEAIQFLEAGQLRFANSPEIDNLLRFAREQQTKAATQQEIDASVRRAHDFIRIQDYDQAIQLLEPILSGSPNDELRIVLEQARQRRDDLNRQIDAAIAKGQQFIAEGSPAKAHEFLSGQPSSFQRSEKFRTLLASVPAPPASKAEPQSAKPKWEAPPPTGTMVWDGTPASPKPASPKARTPAPPRSATGAKTVKPATPSASPRPTRPSKLPVSAPTAGKRNLMLIAGAAAVVVVGVLIWFFTSSGKQQKITSGPVANPTAPAKPAPMGSLSVSTSVDGADIFVDDALRGTTSNKNLVLQLSPGSHSIRAEKQGFAPTTPQSVDVVAGNETPLTLTLTTASGASSAPPKDSYLAIKGPQGAQVLVDGTPAGTLPAGSPLYVKVTPEAPHHIQATLSGYKGWSDTKTAKAGERLEVSAVMPALPKPALISFVANPATIQAGQSATLSWQTSNATEVSIDGVSSASQPSGSVTVSPDKTTVYKLMAMGNGGSISGETTLNVLTAAKKPAVSISASPLSIQAGQSTTLTWQSQNATQILINGTPRPGAEGSAAVTPDKTTTFIVEARGPGGSMTASVTVNVQPVSAPPPSSPTAATNPSPSLMTNDVSAINASLDRLSQAYGTELLSEIKKAWPGMSKQQENGLKQILSNKEMRAIAVQYDTCSAPAFSGDKATLNCTEKMSYTFGGQRKTISQDVSISLKKGSGSWLVEDKGPRK